VHECRTRATGIKLMQDAKQLSFQINFAFTKAGARGLSPHRNCKLYHYPTLGWIFGSGLADICAATRQPT